MFTDKKARRAYAVGILCILTSAQELGAKETAVTAIDIVLKPDSTMRQRALDANAELRKDFPQGFALDATHKPHITLLQRYVSTRDLDKVYVATEKVLAKEKPINWKLDAYKYYYGKIGTTGLAGIVIKPTPDLVRLQKELIEAVAPFSVSNGDSAAFATTAEEPEINKFTMDFVASYVTLAAGDKFSPHVTIGIGTIPYLDKLLAQPFDAFSFYPGGASVYQLGNNGTARKELMSLKCKAQSLTKL